jgi:predicted DNA-binding protein (MmcQ/YjbR family)
MDRYPHVPVAIRDESDRVSEDHFVRNNFSLSIDTFISMTIDDIRAICKKLPGVREGVKWGADLCFMVGDKMFCVTNLEPPFTASFKVRDEEFDEMTSRPGIIPAPYVARYKWVMVEDPKSLKPKDWESYIRQSYDLVRAGLPKKMRDTIR